MKERLADWIDASCQDIQLAGGGVEGRCLHTLVMIGCGTTPQAFGRDAGFYQGGERSAALKLREDDAVHVSDDARRGRRSSKLRCL